MSLSGIVLCCCTQSSFYTSPHWELRAYRPHSIWRAFGSFLFLFFNCTIVPRFWLDRYNIRERCGNVFVVAYWTCGNCGSEEGIKDENHQAKICGSFGSYSRWPLLKGYASNIYIEKSFFPFFFISFSFPFILIYSSRSRLNIGLVDGLDLKGWISTEAKKNLFVTFAPSNR